MAASSKFPMVAFTLLLTTVFLLSLHPTAAQVGVCYGMKGGHLPLEQDVVKLYNSEGIRLMRIYDPNLAALQAAHVSGIQLLLGVPNEMLQSLGSDPSQAMQWVQTNVAPFASSIRYIAVGNEVSPSDPAASSVAPAMQNVQNAINSANLKHVKVSTSISFGLLDNSFPPSIGSFGDLSFIRPIVNFLTRNDSPLLVNIYPYFSYIGDKTDIMLDYALFTAPGTRVIDSNNQLQYQNLFDAQVDAVYAALANAGAPNTRIVVSESGWPSAGGDSASVVNAGTYYRNLISHVKQGTPRKPGPLETYLFAMFDEDQKPGAATEQHFGLFSPSQQPKYGQLSFN